eukprot:TRINITY_DN25515_c0_g1_i1.p1 TRINITY_DN25515_c0_g1~~TRINITY_DN25515_c0_g1_i1.p1  ORF type:complete len:350 (+),score=142.33 TRINITY_DN25515_c0_g1_i1:75-1124(+)
MSESLYSKEDEILAPLHKSLIEEKVAAAQVKRIVEETFFIIKPDAVRHHAEILRRLDDAGFSIECTSMVLTRSMATLLVQHFLGDDHSSSAERIAQVSEQHVAHMLSGTVLSVVLRRSSAVAELLRLVGPPNVAEAKKTAPESFRALYGTDDIANAVYCSPTKDQARRDVVLMLGYSPAHAVEESQVEDRCSDVSDEYKNLTIKEMRDLARRQLRELEEEKERLQAREAEIVRREQVDIQDKLYPNGVPTTQELFDRSMGVIEHCTATNPTSVPITPQEVRALFDSLDTAQTGVVPLHDFKELYQSIPAFENFGVPEDGHALDRQLLPYQEKGITFDTFCLFLYSAAKR